MNSRWEDAVSPVIGVMLMLAITIIIAAVVSSFVSGASTQFEKTPQASLLVYCDGSGGDFNIIFEHLSGDPIRSEDLKVTTWIRDEDGTVTKHVQSDKSPRSSGITPGVRVPFVYDAQKGIVQDMEFGEAVWRPGMIAGTGNKAATAEFLGVSEEDLEKFIASDTPVEITIVHTPSGNIILQKDFVLEEA
ncbi:type IV pilin N-terminal domain-containing protein [Methanofollis ethanolicus]|uniref:type IV pilin N-terminal domain-containing protein n=1 Tax=Methanofollis ethanolicus TaxID=488124 RepID=UPI001366766B|nr:type IV pilin N-terminal domain-containing protein [Methanofollis ethanolicus]